MADSTAVKVATSAVTNGTGVSTFIPNVWAASLIENFYHYSRIGAVTFKPEITTGDKIIYNRVSDIVLKPFNCHEKLEYQTLDLSSSEIAMDQKWYFAFSVCDIEKAQAAGELISPHIRTAMQKAYTAADKWAFNKMATSATTANTVALGSLDADNVYNAIVNMVMKLNSNSVPLTDAAIVIGYDVLSLLMTNPLFTKFRDVLDNGILSGSTIAGVQIVVSPDLPTNTILAVHKASFGFGYQIDKVAYIPSNMVVDAFGDFVKGLQVYGGGLIRPEGLIKGTYTIGTVATPPSGGLDDDDKTP